VVGNKPDQSWRYGIQTPLESQASFSSFDRGDDRVAPANKTFRPVTEAFNVLLFGTLLRAVLIDMRFLMYLGTLKTIALVDHCYDEISHILIAGSELPFEGNTAGSGCTCHTDLRQDKRL
jgi:hypothetical protein